MLARYGSAEASDVVLDLDRKTEAPIEAVAKMMKKNVRGVAERGGTLPGNPADKRYI